MIETATITPILFAENCCCSKTMVAIMHKMNPSKGIILMHLISSYNLKPTKFTMEKMSKKPTLPAVEMLSNSKVFVKVRVRIPVISRPIG